METTKLKNNKIKKKIFRTSLYSDLMRQLRMIALIFIVISLIIVTITTIVQAKKWSNMKEIRPEEYATYTPYTSITAVSPFLVLFMYLGGLMLPFAAFVFLNNRSGSDFYHSVPITRTGLFSSTVLACLTWAMITIFVTLSAVVLGCLVTGMKFYFAFLPYLLMTFCAGTFLIIAIASLAMSITGTRFSNFILFGLILFLPRFIFVMCNIGIQSVADGLVPVDAMGIFLDVSYNLPVALLLSIFMGAGVASMGAVQIFYSTGVAIFTMCLGIVYMAVAVLAFNKRKSETAGSSAMSKTMQILYRCAIALPSTLMIGIMILFKEYELMFMLILGAISVLSYFLFELITTKSVKKMLKAAPMFLGVIIVAALLTGSIYWIASTKLNVMVDASEVQSISVKNDQGGYGYRSGEVLDYNEYISSGVEFDDPELIKICSNALKTSIDRIKNAEESKGMTVQLTFNLNNGGVLKRNVEMNRFEHEKFSLLMQEDEEYIAALSKLPSDDEISNIFYLNSQLEQNQVWGLWKEYRAEYAGLTVEQMARLHVRGSEGGFSIRGMIDGKEFMAYYTVNYRDTPITMGKLINEFNGKYRMNDVKEQLNIVRGYVRQCYEMPEETRDHININVDTILISPATVSKYVEGLPSVEGVESINSNFHCDNYFKLNLKEDSKHDIAEVKWFIEDYIRLINSATLSTGMSDYTVQIRLDYSKDVSLDGRYSYKTEGSSYETYYVDLSPENYETLVLLLNENGGLGAVCQDIA